MSALWTPMKRARSDRLGWQQAFEGRLRRLTVVGLAGLGFAIATVDTASAAADFLLEHGGAATPHAGADR